MIEIPGYLIKREIGQGGMASVYLAIQSSLERQVALKVMAPALAADPTFTRRFLQEARTLASLAHPNIVQVFDVGVTPNQQHYFSMQYLPGGDFVSRVQRNLDEVELKRILTGVARALGYAHQRGYVHRDVAPGNILFDPADNPVLTDFGIALAASQSTRITSAGFSVGTSHYMSPEQARGGDIDARSDIYSLAVLGWYGLTGKPPFDGADGFAVAYAHVFEAVPRLPEHQAHWQELFDRALAKDAKDRYADTEQLLAAIEAIPAREPEPIEGGAPKSAPAPAVRSPDTAAAVAAARQSAPTVAQPRPAAVKKAVESKPAAPAPKPAARSGSGAGLWLAIAVLSLVGFGALGAYFWPRSNVAATPASTVPAATPPAPAPAPPPASEPVAATTPAVEPPPAPPPTETPAGTPTETPVEVAPAGTAPTDPLAADPSATAADPNAAPGAEPIDPVANPAAFLASLPTVEDPVVKLVRLGKGDLAAQRYTSPPNSNALDRFKLALRIDGRDKNARQGIVDTARAYLALADKSQAANDLTLTRSHFERAVEIATVVPAEGKPVIDEVAQRRAKLAGPFLDDARKAAAVWDKEGAKAAYDKALAIDPKNAVAQEGLRKLPSIGSAGYVFRDRAGDGAQGPELVVLPGAKIAAGRTEVTRGEFKRYWAAAGSRAFAGKEPSCRDRESFFRSSRKRTWQAADITQDDSHPVVCVSWDEAAGYARWLSEQTGRTYRLLSNAEFDQLAREVGSGGCTGANLADASFNKAYDTRTGASCDDGYAATSPAGKFPPTASGVFDVDGNAREWVNACANGVPGAGCREHRVRGRSWYSPPDKETAAFTDNVASDVSSNNIGFRIVRELGDRL
ncbi:bifunctional serine/threonine-protein kinase/formylglycine-generating enzyme family protein [Tahibacter soli]|uniref:SUMF1/EgtB/PvdO family nonheme iron enzyme n=1 Tax=Tahibacter soli TaxID=2983605 RepID=A0A9X3YJM9_9GAMM|nr:bifunctional serine/threonine-protein kinase/formylglycine-generating enzyme family protein [Tahibacter soli]MDC8011973.1 SUMF1/EgtB/PvdO family nonheme iron enzyme [Tahibacter soli]